MAVLNAQLQSIVSLAEYARTTKDTEAQRYVERLSTAARTLLPEFDTGCWSRYSLGGSPASDSYHRYHVFLDRLFAEIASWPPDLGGDRRALEGLPQLRLLSRSRNASAFRTAKPSQSLLK